MTSDQGSDVGGQSIDLHAKICRANAIHDHTKLLLGGFKVRLHVNDARNGPDLISQVHDVALQFLDIGSLNQHLHTVSAALVVTLVITAATRR